MTVDAVGGVWTYALDLARGLRARGIGTTLAVLGPDPTANRIAEAQSIPDLELELTRLPLDWLALKRADVTRAGRAIARLAVECGADLVHLSSPALAADVAFAQPVLATCHSCVATWWSAVRGADVPLPPDFAWRADLMQAGFDQLATVVAPSRAFADALVDIYGPGRAPVVVHNGRSPFTSPLSAGGFSRAPAPFVFTAGRLWDEGKDIATLDSAAARVRFPVLAAGPTHGENGAEFHAQSLRTLGIVSREQIGFHLSQRPIFVSTALYEPFGLAVLEAAQAGSSLLLSDIPTFRELWDGVATFVPPGDAGALARAIEDLASDAGLRHAFGVAASRRASLYGLDPFAAAMAELYRAESTLTGYERLGPPGAQRERARA